MAVKKVTEKKIQEDIKKALQKEGVMVVRLNVGLLRTNDGRYISTGIPKGFPDLFCVRDGKAYFIEVKKPNGTRKAQQTKQHDYIRQFGAIVGYCESVEEALELVKN